MRRGLVAALTFVALLSGSATARAAGYVDFVGGASGSHEVDLSQLPATPGPDVVNRTYGDISIDGGPPEAVTVTGYSLGALLSSLKIPPSSFTFAEVTAPDGRSALLTNTQATSPGAYADGPPVVWQDGSGAHFLLPSLPGGGAYAGESFTGAGDTITIDLHTGTLLAVGIASSATKAIVDKPVELTSSVEPADALSYDWSLGDGSVASTSSVTHVYDQTGTYDVYLQVSGAGDSLGISTVLPIVVGEPPPAPVRQAEVTTIQAAGIPGGSGTGGSGSGSGSGFAAGAATTTTHRRPRPHPHRVARPKPPPRPTGPLVSGIAITEIGAGNGGGAGAAGGSPRSAHASAAGTAVGEGFWISLGVLAMLLGGALLELTPRRQSWLVGIGLR
jgi:hypothetical protein